jgi:hypothetical protein
LGRAKASAQLLCSRVEDEKVRNHATLTINAAMVVAYGGYHTPVDAGDRASDSYRKAIDLIGELLRERY